ncbi:MAG: hypothetical protein ACLGJB_17665 [Blastocatellia bacterium]
MEQGNRNQSEFPLKPIIAGGLVYLIYKVVEAITVMITILLSSLTTIAIIGASLFAAYSVFSYIRNNELGENRKTRKVAKIEREMKMTLMQTPKRMHPQVKQRYQSLMEDVYAEKSTSRFDDLLDRSKQIATILRGKNDGNKNTHR